MAKYTETLIEYINGGGVMPTSSFELIDGFEDLFVERYCTSEIGFETEDLFALKLDLKARLVMPAYANKIAIVAEALTGLQNNPVKTRYETRVYGAQHSESENSGNTTDLPYDASSATPANTTETSGTADVDAHTDNLTFTEGLSIDEKLRIVEQMNAKAFILTEQCLEEFKDLFMGVY